MRKVLYFSLLFLCLYESSFAQQLVGIGSNLAVLSTEKGDFDLAPPKLFPPVADGISEDNLLFRWERAVIPDGAQAAYELIIKKGTEVVFSYTTTEPQFVFTNADRYLEKGESYSITVNTQVSDDNSAFVISGQEASISFRYVPDCTAPQNVRITEINPDGMVIAWDGKPASPGVLEYLVRYWPSDQPKQASETRITTGNTFDFFATLATISYQLEVVKVCYWKDGSEMLSTPAPLSISGNTPDFGANCGDPYNWPPCTGPFQETGSWPALSVGGFPIIIQSNQQAPGGGWNGTGRIKLPFGTNKYVRVQWSHAQINTQGRICGTVTGIRDAPPNLPNLNGGPAIWGDEICTNPPSACGFNAQGIHCETGQPWDPFGFNQDSLYVQQPPYQGWQTGMPYDSLYDPNGFNAAGIHFETGTIYGPNGCAQTGFNEQNQPCNVDTIPYYWLQDTMASSEAANELLMDVQDSLTTWVQTMLGFWQNTAQDTITQIETECDGIRTTMNGLIVALGYTPDRELIFGPDDVYFNTGMWKHFSEEPKILNVEITRDPNQIELESKHVDLYHCDKKLDTYAVFKDIVDSLVTNAGIPDLVDVAKGLILNLSEEEAEAFANDHNALRAWLKEQLRDYISETFCDGTCVVEPKPENITPEETGWGGLEQIISSPAPTVDMQLIGRMINPPGSLASVAEEEELFRIFGVNKPEELLQAYLNGDQTINGIDRAFYVEAIGNAKNNAYPLTAANPELLPIDISNLPSDGRTYSIWLDNIVFTASSATLDAYFVLEFPNSGKKIVFSALAVPFTPNGFANTPSIKLQLATDVELRLNNAVKLTLKAGANTFVVFNCTGYDGIGIEFDVEVCRKYVKPLDPGTLAVLPDPARVHTHFQLFMATLDELYFEVNIDPFVVTGIEDYKWLVNGIVVDFSDTKSPNNVPPPGYVSPFANANGFSPLWRGIYLAQLTVQMPNHFKNNGTPTTIGVQKVLIDNMGVSGKLFVTPLLTLNQGNAGGWAFSVDEFSMTVLANQPVNAGFKGLIHVPIFSAAQGSCNTGAPVNKDCFDYYAFIEPNPASGQPVYRMTVTPGSASWCVNMWKSGQVSINPGSQINMLIENGQFKVEANLSGTVKITEALSGNIDISIPDITFQNLTIRNQAPYFSPGTWGFPVPNQIGGSFGGFGLHISKIAMIDNNGSPALSFDAGFKITDDNVGLKADGSFLIKGQMAMVGNKQRWVYQSFQVTDINLDGTFPGVEKLKGVLSFYEGHATYGTGWRGGVQLRIKGLADVSAVAQFGRIKTPSAYKYFFVDALACLDKGFGGALKLKGFGGGVYYHMNRPAASMPLTTGCTGNPIIPPTLGASLSGLVYTPDNTKGLGIKATVALAAALKESAFNGNATLELLFNANGSLGDLWLYGNARFMETPVITASPTKTTQNGAAVRASLDIHMNFNTSTLDGDLEVHMRVSGGTIHGTGDDDLLVNATIHVAPNSWYIKIGSPDQRAGLAVNIPLIGEVGNIGAYMQIGNDIDPMPPLPSDIAALTGLNGTAGLSSRDGALGGKGIIFGADMSIDKQDMEFLIFYAGIKARLGFDVAMLDYGSNAICASTGAPVGINGWYASGQVYAGLWGEVGIKVKVFGKRKQFKIFSVAMAAALQASLPNPFWAKGAVGGHYEILGGLIKGDCQFDVTFGEKCQIVGADDPLGEIAVVQRISPENGSTGVGTDTRPEVFFNFPMNATFSLQDPNGNNVSYKAVFENAYIKYYGMTLTSKITWANDKRSLKLEPEWILPGEDTIEVHVLSHVDSSGVTIYEEERIAHLITGPGLKVIPASNVQGSYPFDGQYNFFPDQIQDRTGYILLKHGQPDLFWNNGDNEKMIVRFKKSCGPATSIPLEYDGYKEKIEFQIPQNFFTPGGIYRMQVLRVASQAGGSSGNSSNKPGGCAETLTAGETVLYTAYFRTSQYNSFGAKLAAWDAAKISTSTGNLLKAEAAIEPFDPVELVPGNYGDGQISMRSSLLNNTWYTGTVSPNLYQTEEPCVNFQICLDGGYAAEYAIEFKPKTANTPPPPTITKDHWVAGSAPGATVVMEMQYKTLKVLEADWKTVYDKMKAYIVNNQLVQEIAGDPHPEKCATGLAGLCKGTCTTFKSIFPEDMRNVFCTGATIPAPPSGDYPVIIRYRMPGTTNWYGSEQVIKMHKN